VFPLASFVFTLAMIGFFLVPVALQPTGKSYNDKSHWSAVANNLFEERTVTRLSGKTEKTLALKPQGMAFAAILYFLCMFLATFFNAAFYHEIFNALRGEPVSLLGGIQFACDRWRPLLYWSLFAGLVGIAIKTLEEKVGLFGKVVLRFVGAAWSVAAVFAIPIIVHESEASNPLDVLRRSAGVVKKTWGEQLVGYAGLQFAGLLAFGVSLWLLGGGFLLAWELESWKILALSAVAWFASLIAISYVSSVASQVYRCVLYLYATEGKAPEGYTPEMLALAWKVKKA
jgi:hypothetical protein